MKRIRLHKWLADSGLASRRSCEKMIEDKRIEVNHKIAEIGQIIDPDVDNVFLDKRRFRPNKKTASLQVILYNKPPGQIVTRKDPQERDTVFQSLPRPKSGRWISVGRLDINTSGLLLFTNDGQLANALMHPSSDLEKEYAVRLRGLLSEEQLKLLKSGVELEDGMASFKSIEERGGEGHNRWYHVVLEQGRNRMVRRLIESQGSQVARLIRVRFGTLLLPMQLKHGQHWLLSDKEVASFLKDSGLSKLLENNTSK